MSKKNESGRSTKLTPKIRHEFAKCLKLGLPIKYCRARLGIGRNTYYEWMKAVRKPCPEDKPFRDFRDSCRKALADGVASRLAVVRKFAFGFNQITKVWQREPNGQMTLVEKRSEHVIDLKAAIWLLERLHPEYFGSQSREFRELHKSLSALEKHVAQIHGSAGDGNEQRVLIVGPTEPPSLPEPRSTQQRNRDESTSSGRSVQQEHSEDESRDEESGALFGE